MIDGPEVDTNFVRAARNIPGIDVLPQQGAIYRLSGDLNPMHIDPEFARNFGFEAPFLHGLCSYGIVGRAILSTVCGGDAARFTHVPDRHAERRDGPARLPAHRPQRFPGALSQGSV